MFFFFFFLHLQWIRFISRGISMSRFPSCTFHAVNQVLTIVVQEMEAVAENASVTVQKKVLSLFFQLRFVCSLFRPFPVFHIRRRTVPLRVPGPLHNTGLLARLINRVQPAQARTSSKYQMFSENHSLFFQNVHRYSDSTLGLDR
jgi:hypothetical protein